MASGRADQPATGTGNIQITVKNRNDYVLVAGAYPVQQGGETVGVERLWRTLYGKQITFFQYRVIKMKPVHWQHRRTVSIRPVQPVAQSIGQGRFSSPRCPSNRHDKPLARLFARGKGFYNGVHRFLQNANSSIANIAPRSSANPRSLPMAV